MMDNASGRCPHAHSRNSTSKPKLQDGDETESGGMLRTFPLPPLLMLSDGASHLRESTYYDT